MGGIRQAGTPTLSGVPAAVRPASHVAADREARYLAVVREWGRSIESSDRYTYGHCERVATYAVAVARTLGRTANDLTTIRVGAYLHDVGKVRVPSAILRKPGPLTRAEFDIMRRHPAYGVALLSRVELPWNITPIILWHHEKYDGSGYPDGLAGEQIPLGAQIIGIADVYDALTTTRAYRTALTSQQARDEIAECRHWWREDVVCAFFAATGRGHFGLGHWARARPSGYGHTSVVRAIGA